MEKRQHWKEIRNKHFVTEADLMPNDGDICAAISIDAWKTSDDWEEGQVIAYVMLSISGDILVSYHNNLARVDEAAQAAIEEAKAELRNHWREQRQKRKTLLVEQLLKHTLREKGVYLKKPILEPHHQEPNCYRFTCKLATWSLFNILNRLAMTGAISKAQSLKIIGSIQEEMLAEFSKLCPPPVGKHYENAGIGYEYCLMLRIAED